MVENDKTEEFLQKLAPCIQRGELDACVEEAARLADEFEIGADELVELSSQMGRVEKYELLYVLALGALEGLDDSDKVAAYSNAGLAAKSFGNAGMAEENYKKAIECDPKYATAHNNYAILLEELGQKDVAEWHYKKAIEFDPNFAAAHYNYANLLEELGQKDVAEWHYIKAIEFDPNDVAAHNNYANLLEEFGKKDEAEKHYKKAIKSDSNYALAHNNYAILLAELGKKDEAEKHYKKALESDLDDANTHNNYANHLRERRRFYDAEKEVRIALQIAEADPSNQYVLPYAHGTLGDILADEDYHENAIKEYEKSLNLLEVSHSEDVSFISEIHNNLGWAYVQLKKSTKARDEFKSACALDSMNVKAIRNLRALGKVGSESGVSRIQIYLSIMLLLPFIASYYLFYVEKLSETLFVTQSIFLVALVIFVVLYPELSKVKIGAIEFEKSTEFRSMEAKSMAMERMSDIER